MKIEKLLILGFSLFVTGALEVNAQHITVPIHYSKWIQNYAPADSLRGITTFSNIPIAFFMEEADGKVKQYEKLEIGIDLPDDAKKLISNFIQKGNGMNPFDPSQLDIRAFFMYVDTDKSIASSTSDKKIKLIERSAFYYEEFITKNDNPRLKHGYWEQDSTSFNFRIRFAPDKLGWWTCTINIFANNELLHTLPSFDFLCVPGNSDGFINGISENKRLLQFENGKNFFGIGQNIPIADLNNAVKPGGLSKFKSQPPHGFDLQRSYIKELAENGGNLIRIMNGEWADAIEWEKLNDYSMNMNVAWEQDRTFDLCLEKNVYLLWTLQYHAALMYHNPFGNDELAWPSSPYHLQLGIEIPEDFFTNTEAIKFYQYKLRYQLSRWGYSRMIAGLQLVNELNEMAADPKNISVHPYFTDSTFRNKVGKWFLTMKNYLQEDLKYDFLVGSSFTGDLSGFVVDDPVMKISDFNAYHPYGENRNRNVGARFGGMNITPGYGVFKRYQKPTIIGEMGVWETEFLYECHENEFHTDLWATTFMGGWAGGLHWHNWEDNFKMNLRKNFFGLHTFLKNVNFTEIEWTPKRFPEKNINETVYSKKGNDHFENLYMTGNKKLFNDDRAFGWVHNRSHYWYNLPETDCEKEKANSKTKENTGKKSFRPSDDDEGEFVKYEGNANKKKRMTRIDGLQNFKKFHIDWIDTKTGLTIKTTSEYHGMGKFKINIPDEINQQEYQDLGYKIYTGKCFTNNCINVNF